MSASRELDWMLNLRIVRGPLLDAEEKVILEEYNRLTGAQISLDQFKHWVRDSPEGPSWHAILETDDSKIVGHFSIIPLRAEHEGEKLIAAKSEYFFVNELYRREKVRGFEKSYLTCAILLPSKLFESCHSLGWGPFLTSVSEEIQPFYKALGCRPANFELSECLLILRPLEAARRTPNLTKWQRMALFLVGAAQRLIWPVANMFLRESPVVRFTSASSVCLHPQKDRIAFFQDSTSVTWRYPDEEYVTLTSATDSNQYLIAKHGSNDRYLRVCQWHIEGKKNRFAFLLALINQAKQQKALGVRWSLYSDAEQSDMLSSLRKLGFLCVHRDRKLFLYTNKDIFLKPEAWSITDSFFCLDL